jgi:glycerophosphoryl diester phosphodiesterase
MVSEDNIWLKENNGSPLVISHAGGKAFPGNTMSAMQYSFDLGVDVLEMDVHLSKDGVVVLRHGENKTGNIRAMSNCDGVIWESNYIDLYETCNFGYNYKNENGEFPYRGLTHDEWVEAGVYLLTLEEVFSAFGDRILYNIEIKADADAPRIETADALYELIVEHDLIDNVLVATNYEDISSHIRENYKDVYISASHAVAQDGVVKTYTFVDMFFDPDNTVAFQLPVSYGFPVIETIHLDTGLLIRNLHQKNIAIHYWTINDEDEMRNLIELGADGIITDDPELLMKVIDEISE